jgi:hypothetical protein
MEVRNEELHPKEGALIMIIINMPMPVNWIVLHIEEPHWYSMTAALFGQGN